MCSFSKLIPYKGPTYLINIIHDRVTFLLITSSYEYNLVIFGLMGIGDVQKIRNANFKVFEA